MILHKLATLLIPLNACYKIKILTIIAINFYYLHSILKSFSYLNK